MPTNHDYWNENISTVFTDVVEIFEADEDRQPIYPEKVIRLNNSGNTIIVDNEEYMPASFTFNEPDRTSVNDETGSLSIGGVTHEYIEMLNEADEEHLIVVRIGLVNYQTHDWVLRMVDYVANNISINSATATLQVNFRSGAMQLSFYASKLRYINTEFPCLFG